MSLNSGTLISENCGRICTPLHFSVFVAFNEGGGGRRQETVALLDNPINGGEGDSSLTKREVEKCAQYLDDAQRCKREWFRKEPWGACGSIKMIQKYRVCNDLVSFVQREDSKGELEFTNSHPIENMRISHKQGREKWSVHPNRLTT